MEGRCMKCKKQQDMVEVEIVLVGPRKTRMAKGKCATCGCKMCRILPAEGPVSPKKKPAKKTKK